MVKTNQAICCEPREYVAFTNVDSLGNPRRELFMPGARYPWPELVERVTGAPLGVDALAAAVDWPRAT